MEASQLLLYYITGHTAEELAGAKILGEIRSNEKYRDSCPTQFF